MPTPPIKDELRAQIVAYYHSVPGATYLSTAATFGVGAATVSRLLRQHREQGTTNHVPKPIVREKKIDEQWLRDRVAMFPNARLRDHAEAFEKERGETVSLVTVWHRLKSLGLQRTGGGRRARGANPTASKSSSDAKQT